MPRGPDPILLLTRPDGCARDLAGRIGWPVILSPIIAIRPVDHDGATLARAPGLVFTSAHAVHAVAAAGPGRGRPAICVGARTGAAARAAGFAVRIGPGDAAGLRSLIAASPVPLIHPQGRHTAVALPVPGIIVYDQVEQPLNGPARAALQGDGPVICPVICPVYSPRSSRLLSGQIAALGARGGLAPLWVVSISAAADAAWQAVAARRRIAIRPDAPGMEAAIRRVAVAEQS